MNQNELDILAPNGPGWCDQSASDPMMNGMSDTTAIWMPLVDTSAPLKYAYAWRFLGCDGAPHFEIARIAVAKLARRLRDFVTDLEIPNAYFFGHSLGTIMIAAIARTVTGREEHNVLNSLIYGHG